MDFSHENILGKRVHHKKTKKTGTVRAINSEFKIIVEDDDEDNWGDLFTGYIDEFKMDEDNEED